MSINIRIITNSRKRKRSVDFVDKRHDTVVDTYYDAVEMYESEDELLATMQDLMSQDDTFFDSYIVAADLLSRKGNDEKAKKIIEVGTEKALRSIVDRNGDWPEHMDWGWLENRHIMRILEQYADYCHGEENTEDALYVYRKLLQMNPNDNQGVRYKILAIRLGLQRDEWYKPFLVKKGPMAGQAMEPGPLLKWFEKNAKKFPDEFHWWFEMTSGI